jgi:hypothetical protein
MVAPPDGMRPRSKEGVKGKTGEQTESNFIIEICSDHNSVVP